MADDADRADDRITNMIADGMAKVRRELERSLIPIVIIDPDTNKRVGVCHYCESEVGAGRLFCGLPCSQNWDALQAARKRNGS